MSGDLQIRYHTEDQSWLCFKHAVAEAMNCVNVMVDIDDFKSSLYLGTTSCVECDRLRDFGVKGALESTGAI